jgi:hypothetical protein
MTVNLEYVINGLRALHVLEALSIDSLLVSMKFGSLSQSDFKLLKIYFPELNSWDGREPFPSLALIKTQDDFIAYFTAIPIIHPIFARLIYYKKPFNALKPIGVGDLKVVKQWLVGYKAGEIAHIDNVLLGETKTRTHRHLEKTEEVFSYSSEQQEETQRDTQTTDRFELKRESENVMKNDINVNAGLSVNASYTGTGYTIQTGVTGGFAYTRSQSDVAKSAENFARDVVDKAVKRVQSRTSQQRSTTKLFEAEETNFHSFENKPPNTQHISGIYRWIDKEYKAQLFNYGKRMMFEFVLPEPAAFLVESRLRGYESQIDLPRPPQKPAPLSLPQWVKDLKPNKITKEQFLEYSQQYDLSSLSPPTYPTTTKRVELIDQVTNKNYYSETGMDFSTYQSRIYNCRINAKDYEVTKIGISGYLFFWGKKGGGTDSNAPNEINTFEVRISGQPVFQLIDNERERFYFAKDDLATEYPVTGTSPLIDDNITLFLGFWDISKFDLSFTLELTLSTHVLESWQAEVCKAIKKVEQTKVDEQNRALEQAYQSQLSTYHNRLAELRATSINDLLQGQSEAFNRQIIMRELKRQCLTMLTKEFDLEESDDILTNLEAIGSRTVRTQYRRLDVTEIPDTKNPTSVTVDFNVVSEDVEFPASDLPRAKTKGRYIQFLEQAFEWQQLSYLLYPYFWATPPKWIELMNRSDQTDPFLSAFLQAGSARVLLAVTPAYNQAVLHYLATGEPWEGGPSPVIGDPLFIPLYEEIKEQQDDLAEAKPEGKSWRFTLPTSLVYLENSSTPLPEIPQPENQK